MTLRSKLVIIILFVAVVPLGISAVTTLGTHRDAFDARTSELHIKTAEYGAAATEQYFAGAQRSLARVVTSIRWGDLSAEEANGAVWLAYRQVDELAAASLLDATGQGVGPSAFTEAGAAAGERNHPAASLASLKEFAARIPFERAQREGTAMGPVFLAGGPTVPLAFRVDGPQKAAWVFAVALSLEKVCRQLSQLSPAGAAVHLFDPEGQPVCNPQAPAHLEKLPALAPGRGTIVRVDDPQQGELLTSYAQTTGGWRVVVEQPVRIAFASSRRILAQTLFWIGLGLVVALVAGLFLAQSITRPVRMLVDGALQLGKGNFEHPLPVESKDELGQLSQAFNQMGTEIRARDGEIRSWNENLQRRVDERTRELKETQEQLLQSQKIAAVTGLAAGIAHEINNPLAGVIGLTQVLLARSRTDPAAAKSVAVLGDIEREALRIKGIVATLVNLGQDYSGKGHSTLNVNELLDSALDLVDKQARASNIEIVREYEPQLPPVVGSRAQLQQVILNIFSNARQAMSARGGKLTITTTTVDDRLVKVAMKDTGKGIAADHLDKIFEPFFTTKEDWKGEGLGLTVAFRVIEEHRGTIKAESPPGHGATLTIMLPAARRATHLE